LKAVLVPVRVFGVGLGRLLVFGVAFERAIGLVLVVGWNNPALQP
jgi:hypothetical protein